MESLRYAARYVWDGLRGRRGRDAINSLGTRLTRKARWFWPLAMALLVADCATKRAVESRLAVGEPQPVVGNVVRFTLSYNDAAAMGISLGGHSRLLLTVLSLIALFILGVLYHRTRAGERLRTIGVALIIGGAAGNLLDRLRSATGVVDFIDVGVRNVRFWTFNLADVGITAGAFMLLIAMGRWRRRDHSTALPRGLSPS